MNLFIQILFSIFTSLNFFIKGQFFAGSGTSDLLNYFTSVPYICILVIPAICFRKNIQIYEDFIPKSTISKLLINFKKIFIEYSIMILMMIPVCLIVNLFGQVDFGQVFTSILCLFFYGAAVISVCLFLNELFNNNILSFVISALILAVFNSIHSLAIYINLPEFISSIFKYFSFAWHFDAASKGIVDTRDLLWFLFIFGTFIFINFFTKEIKKGRCFNKQEKKFYYGIFALFILCFLNCSKYYFRIDCSKNKTYSISKYTKSLINLIDDKVTITYYRSGALSKLYPQIRDISDYLTTYASYNKNINFIIKDPDKDEKIKTTLENYGITTQQLKTTGTNSTEYINVYSAITIENKGNIQLIPFLMSAQTLEYDLDNNIKQLITNKQIIANIVIGNGMTLADDYNFIIPYLNSQGILVNPLYIEDPSFTTNLSLSSGPLIVIGDSEIGIENAIAIENYILSNKGNALFAVNPYSSNIETDWYITENKKTNIVEMLENWGVTFTNKITADISCAQITMYSQDEETDPFTQANVTTHVMNYPLWNSLLPQENSQLGMTLFWPVKLELSQNAFPYLVTSSMGYYYEVDRASPDKLIETNPFLLEEEDISGKQKESQIIGAQITGPLSGLFNYSACEDSNIIVVSDQYFLNTLMTGYIGGDFGDYRNFEFLSNCILKLNNEEELSKLQSKTTRDTSLYKVSEINQFIKLELITYLFILIILPAIYILFAVIKKIIYKKRINLIKKDIYDKN